LATDGLFDNVDPEDLNRRVSQVISEQKDYPCLIPRKLAWTLAHDATKGDARDDIAVIVAQIVAHPGPSFFYHEPFVRESTFAWFRRLSRFFGSIDDED